MMQVKKLPDIPDFISFSTESLDEAVDFGHALVELRIEFQYHGFGKKYHFIVDEKGMQSILEGAIAGMVESVEELIVDAEQTPDQS